MKSGAQSVRFENSIVLLPAASVRDMVFAPTVVKLPVGVNDSVCAAPPLTLTSACQPEPSQYRQSAQVDYVDRAAQVQDR